MGNGIKDTSSHRAKALTAFIIASAFSFWTVAASHAQITLDGTMGPKGPLHGPDYRVGAELGQARGGNLFHSFGEFNIRKSESATFTGPAAVENIIGRVTGGNPSSIDGLLRSDIDGANLFLINPSGVMFGPDARLDVKGSFHVSTADYLRFADGERLYANSHGSSVLSVAAIESFGFLSEAPRGISIDKSRLELPAGKTLSIIGGDLDVIGGGNSSFLYAPSGRIKLASVASPGEVVPINPWQARDLDVDTFERRGTISFSDGADLSVSGNPGGSIFIRAGRLTMTGKSGNGSIMSASSTGNARGPATGIDIDVTGEFSFPSGELYCSSNSSADAGDILIRAGSFILGGDPETYPWTNVGSRAWATGNAGNVTLEADRVEIRDGAFINTFTANNGEGGDVSLRTRNLLIHNGAFLGATVGGTGDGGDVFVDAGLISLVGAGKTNTFTGIVTQSWGIGDAGDLSIRARLINIANGSEISTGTRGVGNAGNLSIDASELFMEGSSNPSINTGVFSNSLGAGKGGNLKLKAQRISLSNRASVEAAALGSGEAGNVQVQAESLEISKSSYISTSAVERLGIAKGGDIDVVAKSINISGPESSDDPFGRDATGLTTSVRNGEKAGDIRIHCDDLSLKSRARINSSTYGSGIGGSIEINAENLSVLEGSQIMASTFGKGEGGKVQLQTDNLLVSGVHPQLSENTLHPSSIACQADPSGGNAGEVHIVTDKLRILDGGRLSTETFGDGSGGAIMIASNSTRISGTNDHLREFLAEHGLDHNRKRLSPEEAIRSASAGIFADSDGSYLQGKATGDAGSIFLCSGELVIIDHGLISSRTSSGGSGGKIDLEVSSLKLLSGGEITSSSDFRGHAGSVEIQVMESASLSGSLDGMSSGIYSKSNDLGNAGGIHFSGPKLSLSNDAEISTTARGSGEGGGIEIDVDRLNLFQRAVISSRGSGSGNAGDISLKTGNTHMRSSTIKTDSENADGGEIHFHRGHMLRLIDSEITASVGGGRGTLGGNILMEPQLAILQGSRITANAFEGQGGRIEITGSFLADPSSKVEAEAQSRLGIDGTVDIHAPIRELAGVLEPLPKDFVSAPALLREPCEARYRQKKQGSLVVKGRDSVPSEPGLPMPSPLR